MIKSLLSALFLNFSFFVLLWKLSLFHLLRVRISSDVFVGFELLLISHIKFRPCLIAPGIWLLPSRKRFIPQRLRSCMYTQHLKVWWIAVCISEFGGHATFKKSGVLSNTALIWFTDKLNQTGKNSIHLLRTGNFFVSVPLNSNFEPSITVKLFSIPTYIDWYPGLRLAGQPIGHRTRCPSARHSTSGHVTAECLNSAARRPVASLLLSPHRSEGGEGSPIIFAEKLRSTSNTCTLLTPSGTSGQVGAISCLLACGSLHLGSQRDRLGLLHLLRSLFF